MLHAFDIFFKFSFSCNYIYILFQLFSIIKNVFKPLHESLFYNDFYRFLFIAVLHHVHKLTVRNSG